MTWSDRFIATNLRGPFEALGHADANLVIDPVYGAILMRIGRTGMWRCTYKEPSHLPIASYLERVPAHLRAFTRGQIDVEVVASSPYRMHQRAADAFRVERVLLAGDAAHITNPTGGLGLTAGFHDAFSLAETLGAVVRGRAPQDLLTTWADARRAAFYERISPAATANKQLLFDGVDPVARETGIQQLRLVAGDEEGQRNQLLLMAGAMTPSLVEQRHPEGASK
jgi:2-polyprenyl-6-methoxyphenol hydroxylase-like FAD-dependent oxidoreductase